MVELDENALDEARSRSETLTLEQLVEIVETYHRDGQPGVDRDVLDAYLEALAYEATDVGAEIDNHLTNSDDWTPDQALYDLGDDRISVFPPDWHDRLRHTDDITEYVRAIQDDVTETEGREEDGVTETGVPEQLLFRAAAAIGGRDREATREEVVRLRREGVLEETADQHPSGTVRLA